MSNIFKTFNSGSPVPPTIATSYVTDDGTAIPALNVLNVNAVQSSENNNNGAITRATPNLGNVLDVVLTNRISGTATTTDGVTPVTLTNFSLGATPATYLLEIKIIAFNVTDNLSAGYTSTSTLRTTGAAGSEISANPGIISEETTMVNVVVQNQISGNNVQTIVTGLPGKTIHWRALNSYIMVT